MDKEQIAQELIRRGVSPDKIAAAGYGQIAQQGRTGLIAPPLNAPDPVAARSAYGRDYNRLSERRETLGRHTPNLANLERFQALNRVQRTGGMQHQTMSGFAERINPLEWPGAVGNMFAKFDPEIREMSSIASGLQGQARPAGSGATSDFEQRLYRMGVPSEDKPGPVNDNIIRYQKGVIAEERDRTAFDDEFIRRNGSLSGSSEAWANYVTAHPYIVTDAKGRTQLNTKRPDWRQHFGLEAPKAPAGGSGGSGRPRTPVPRPSAVQNKTWSALTQQGVITRQGERGSATNPYVATTPEMMEGLRLRRPGSYVIAPDGRYGIIE